MHKPFPTGKIASVAKCSRVKLPDQCFIIQNVLKVL